MLATDFPLGYDLNQGKKWPVPSLGAPAFIMSPLVVGFHRRTLGTPSTYARNPFNIHQEAPVKTFQSFGTIDLAFFGLSHRAAGNAVI